MTPTVTYIILTFYMTYALTFYLTYVLTFYRANLLAFYLTHIFWHFFWFLFANSLWLVFGSRRAKLHPELAEEETRSRRELHLRQNLETLWDPHLGNRNNIHIIHIIHQPFTKVSPFQSDVDGISWSAQVVPIFRHFGGWDSSRAPHYLPNGMCRGKHGAYEKDDVRHKLRSTCVSQTVCFIFRWVLEPYPPVVHIKMAGLKWMFIPLKMVFL